MSKKGLGCLVLKLELQIYQLDDGIITGFIFDDRIFKETGRLSDIKTVKEKQRTEVPKHVPIKVSKKKHLIVVITEKHCPKCDITKPVKDFNKSSYDHTGYQSYCRDCSNKVRAINKEKQPDITLEKQPDIKPVKEIKKTFEWTKERDKIICDNFGELGISGIYDKSLLPGFSLMEIRNRCRTLNLIDQYGNTK